MEIKYVLVFKENVELELTNAQQLGGEKAKEISDSIKARFSELAKQRREKLGYSVQKLSHISGISTSKINKLEKGDYKFDLEFMFKISYPLKIKYGDFLSCFIVKAEEKIDYIKTLKMGDIIGIYSTCEKAEATIKNFTKTYKSLKKENFDIREILWD